MTFGDAGYIVTVVISRSTTFDSGQAFHGFDIFMNDAFAKNFTSELAYSGSSKLVEQCFS